mmetsp:Transcript_1119/g.3448  ORF Transcript_1119/g.3448 Transcript_1119/m.3448 type:complete len:205 (+) Transcript_1119:239-853(+)
MRSCTKAGSACSVISVRFCICSTIVVPCRTSSSVRLRVGSSPARIHKSFDAPRLDCTHDVSRSTKAGDWAVLASGAYATMRASKRMALRSGRASIVRSSHASPANPAKSAQCRHASAATCINVGLPNSSSGESRRSDEPSRICRESSSAMYAAIKGRAAGSRQSVTHPSSVATSNASFASWLPRTIAARTGYARCDASSAMVDR